MPIIQLSRWFAAVAAILSIVACNNLSTQKSDVQSQVISANNSQQLTIKKIFAEQEFKSDKIGQIRWLKDGSGYTALEDSADKISNEQGEEVSIGKEVVVYNPETLERTLLISIAQLTAKGSDKPLTIDDYIWSDNRDKLLIYTNSKKVWRSKSRGDYWLLDLNSKVLSQLGGANVKTSSLMFAKFSSDANKVAYVVDNNIFVEDLKNQHITQLTNDGGDGVINGLFDWVYEEEFAIKDGFRWSPDGSKIAYWQLDTNGSKDFIMINNTDELYPTLTKFPYPKVGEINALANIGVVDLASQQTLWLTLPNNSRDMYIPRMNWSGNSEQILVQHVNRKQDRNHLYLANVATGKLNKIFTEADEFFLDDIDDALWLEDGANFIWASERNGWRHLYKISRDGQSVIDLTTGKFDVVDIEAIDQENGWLYFIASPDNITQRYLYRSKLDGSISNQRITPENFSGTNSYQMSDDGQWAIHTHSTFNQPKQISLVKIAEHQTKHQLMNNQRLISKLNFLKKPSTEFFQVNAQDGVVLDGYIMRPADFDASKKYPIIFYVYGEPAGQTVKDSWRGNKYLWDQMLTEQGYLVASIDNRGTKVPKGRAWRKSIYGAVGILSSRDQADALTAMANKWSYIDTKRVGIWGHSGGGSMTLNMLFRYPEQYHVGISSAPVADQRLYDSIYQERYSGLLSDYAEGYQQGSPITHAKNLKGKLLLIHGTGDDNVHYQASERLINELVKHHKQFEFMSYPNRSHSLKEGDGTTVHYKTLKTEFFNKYL